MPRPWRIRFPGTKYHVTSRGNGRAPAQGPDGDIVWPEAGKVPLESVLAVVAAHFNVPEDDLRFHGRRLGMVKAVAIDLYCRFGGETQREVAEAFGYRDGSSVGKRRQVLATHLAEDPTLRRQVARIEKRINTLKS